MPDLQHTLQGNDLGFLKMVAGTWGIELNAPDAHTGLPLLLNALLNPALVNEVVETLQPEAQRALQALVESEGRMPWAQFARRYGDVRAMGAGRRDRERPDLKPSTPAEVLWYRALIGKAFFNQAQAAEPQEYAYIPDDLLDLMSPVPGGADAPLGRAASPGETAQVRPAADRIVDHACTLLAALRLGLDIDQIECAAWGMPPRNLQALLRSAGLLDAAYLPVPESSRDFLESSRAEALAQLAKAWMESDSFNELRQLSGLKFEGEWTNKPMQTRKFLMDLLTHLPEGTWWNLASFVAGVAERFPDFQRPAGDYDSWFIRRESDGAYLRGFSTWDEVDGALVRWLITGPMHWLGIIDLAAPAAGAAPTAFRAAGWSQSLWHGTPPKGLKPENGQVKVSPDGQMRVAALTPRSARYQIARFSIWEGESSEEYRYRVSPASLERARKQGLRTSHLVTLLKKHAAGPLPPTLLQALERWEKFGAQAKVEKATVLRLASADILKALQASKAARYLGEPLNATTVIIKPGGEEAVARALAELGYLTE